MALSFYPVIFIWKNIRLRTAQISVELILTDLNIFHIFLVNFFKSINSSLGLINQEFTFGNLYTICHLNTFLLWCKNTNKLFNSSKNRHCITFTRFLSKIIIWKQAVLDLLFSRYFVAKESEINVESFPKVVGQWKKTEL